LIMATSFLLILGLFMAIGAAITEARWTIPDFCNRPKPWALSDIHPELHVFTRSKNDQATVHNESDLSNFVQKLDEQSYFHESRRVIFMVHGYLGYMPWTHWLSESKDALLKIEDATIFQLVWAKGADVFYNYGQSASNTQTMAAVLSKLALDILDTKTFKGDKDSLYLHCVGHSLGAQICGQAGRMAQIFDRATGLDPAGPGFEKCPDKLHIDVDSATCVDNIHTDGTMAGHWGPQSLGVHFGTLESWGHIDFYPNGGKDQPGCWVNDVPPCSHSMATKFFAYTIENGPKACLANGVCSDAQKIPGSCVDNTTQPMGYFSTCHGGGKDLVPGRFHLSTVKGKVYC